MRGDGAYLILCGDVPIGLAFSRDIAGDICDALERRARMFRPDREPADVSLAGEPRDAYSWCEVEAIRATLRGAAE